MSSSTGPMCVDPTTDCPQDANQCIVAICSGGVCSTAFAPPETGCQQKTKGVCDGNGNCVDCLMTSDCTTPATCVNEMCVQPSCNDGMKNGNETGVDCGGNMCPPCGLQSTCAQNSDCQSGLCTNGICACGANMTSNGNVCVCNPGFIDCDGKGDDGCESPVVLSSGVPVDSGNGPGKVTYPSGLWMANGSYYALSWTDANNQYMATTNQNGVVINGPTQFTTTGDILNGNIFFQTPFVVGYTRSSGLYYKATDNSAQPLSAEATLLTSSLVQHATFLCDAALNIDAVFDQQGQCSDHIGGANNVQFEDSFAALAFSGSVFGWVLGQSGALAFNVIGPANGNNIGGFGIGVPAYQPKVAWDGNDFGIVFVSSASGSAIQFVASNENGTPGPISQISTSNGVMPAIAAGAGGFRVVWVNPVDNQLYYSRVKEDGTVTGGEYQITSVAQGVRKNPFVIWNSTAQEYAVLYEDTRNAGRSDLYFQRLPACAP